MLLSPLYSKVTRPRGILNYIIPSLGPGSGAGVPPEVRIAHVNTFNVVVSTRAVMTRAVQDRVVQGRVVPGPGIRQDPQK